MAGLQLSPFPIDKLPNSGHVPALAGRKRAEQGAGGGANAVPAVVLLVGVAS